MRYRFLYAASLAAAACAPKAPPVPAPAPGGPAPMPPAPPAAQPITPPPAQATSTRFGPSALRYAVHRRIHVEQQVRGQTVALDRGVRAFVSALIMGPADSVGYVVSLTIDSLVPDSGTVLPASINVGAVRGVRYVGRVTPTGVLHNVVPSDSVLAGAVGQVFGSFQGFYPRLPPSGLVLGADWADTVSTVDRSLVEITTKYINRSRATAWEQRAGARCLRVEVTSGFTLAGSGLMSGQPREVSGSGTRIAVQFVAIDGRYLGGEIRDSVAITTRFPAEGESVPGTQVSQITVTVLQ